VEVEELPLTPNGKLDRKRLPEPEHTPSALLIEPRDAIEMRLKTVWAEILGINEIGITDNFFDLGGHSLTAVSVSAYISRIYGARFSVRTIFERPTIWQLAEFLRQTKSLLKADSVVPIQPAGKKTPFFCVHPAGGMAHCYLPLARHLGPDQPFYGFQAHGLERAQSLAISIEEMAATYIKNMKDVQPNGPYQLGGWSLGAIIAYEMAQQLTASGDKVQSLILLDGRPNFTPLSAPWTEEELRDYEQRHVDLVLARLGLSEAEIDAMTYEQQLERCISQPKADASSVPLTVTSTQFRNFLRVQATNEALVKRYHIQPYPGNLVLFKSSTPGPPEEGFGWERLAAGGVVIHSFQEEHARFVAEPNAQVVAEKLAACINDGPTLKQMPVQTLQTTLLQRSEVPYDR
jgi:thioesterase domain-containing protein/acyl carrier protein